MWIPENGSKRSGDSAGSIERWESRSARPALWLLLFFVLLTAPGCGSAPEDEHSRALEAVEQARNAGAIQYAPQTFTRATDELALAETELSAQQSKKIGFTRRFGRSRELFLSTTELAGSAREEATVARERAGQELDAILAELRTRMANAEQIVDGETWALFRDRSPDPGAMMELEDELSALDGAREDVERALADGDVERALRVGRAALDQLRTLETLIDETSKTGKVSFHFEK